MVDNPSGPTAKKPTKMLIKVDWLSFTLSPKKDVIVHNSEIKKFAMLKYLDLDLKEFEKIPGRFFYNSGFTLSNMVNVYFDDPALEISKYSAGNVLYTFTGQGSTLLLQKLKEKYALDWEKSWLKYFNYLQDLEAKVTRIDLAVDCFHHELDLNRMERKLKHGEYNSIKRQSFF